MPRTAEPSAAVVIAVERQLLEQRVVAQNPPGADDHRRQRVLDELHRQARFLVNASIQAAEHRSAAAQRDAPIVDVGRELRRHLDRKSVV